MAIPRQHKKQYTKVAQLYFSVLGDPFIRQLFLCPVQKGCVGCPESQLCEKDDQEDDPGEESEQAGESKLIQQDRLQLGQQEGRTHLHHHQDANHSRPGGA